MLVTIVKIENIVVNVPKLKEVLKAIIIIIVINVESREESNPSKKAIL